MITPFNNDTFLDGLLHKPDNDKKSNATMVLVIISVLTGIVIGQIMPEAFNLRILFNCFEDRHSNSSQKCVHDPTPDISIQ